MTKLFHIFRKPLLLCCFLCIAQMSFSFQNTVAELSICSWNIRDLGVSKSEESLLFIAKTIKDYDIIAIQEVVTSAGGSQAIAKIVDALNRMGNTWDYAISPPTSSNHPYKIEKYAFIWKKNKVAPIGKFFLDPIFKNEIDREPYIGTFSIKKTGKKLSIFNYHAITKKLDPATEIKYFKFYLDKYPQFNKIFAGDFNCPQSHSVFNPIKNKGFIACFTGQKTTLKKLPKNGQYLASEFDNFYIDSAIFTLIAKKPLLFYQDFESLSLANKVSDHLPIVIYINVKRGHS